MSPFHLSFAADPLWRSLRTRENNVAAPSEGESCRPFWLWWQMLVGYSGTICIFPSFLSFEDPARPSEQPVLVPVLAFRRRIPLEESMSIVQSCRISCFSRIYSICDHCGVLTFQLSGLSPWLISSEYRVA